ncbi:MAG: metallophosphatase [Desulfobulbaceae bacterium]|nr:metallophosphatase [Desulfobulbaceae bacterium]
MQNQSVLHRIWFEILVRPRLFLLHFRYPLFSACLLFLFTAVFGGLAQDCHGAEAAGLSSRWPVCDPFSASQKISFVHVSDMHASYNPDAGGTSPLARMRGFVDQVREENPYTIFSNGGDDYEKGSIAEELSRGRSTRQVVQAMGYDLRTIGNHDFAWGLDELLAYSHDATAVVLATNTSMTAKTSAGASDPGWVDYAEITVGCVRIGFFGLVSRPWNEHGEQVDGPYYEEHPELQTDFNYAAVARRIVEGHRRDVDLLVLVSHLGIDDDIRLAQEVEGIDIILGGHSHTTMTQPQQVGNTIILHTGSYAENLGRFDLDYDLRARRIAGSRFALVANEEGAAPVCQVANREITGILSPYHQAIEEDFVRLCTGRNQQEMARIAARAALHILGADAAMISPQSTWKGGAPGGMTRQEILAIFPVEREPSASPGASSLSLLQATGADLLHARASLPDFVYEGVENIDPAAIYTIALPKAQAWRQVRYFGRRISLATPVPAGELWEIVGKFGYEQNEANLALDERPGKKGDDLIAALFARGW